jgi:hypothetical protein
MKQLQDILKYTKDLVEQEPEKSSYWHYNKLVSKIEEAIDVMHHVCPVCDGRGKGNFEADSQEIWCDSCEGTGQIVT